MSDAGEVILSSDGMDPVRKQVPVSTPSFGSMFLNDNATLLDTLHIEATDAFEVFAGKLYPTPGGAVSIASKTTEGGSTTTTTPSTTATKKKNETPLQRLARLQQEMMEVEEDLKASRVNNEEENVLMTTTIPQMIEELKLRLETTAQQNSHRDAGSQQREMTQLIQKRLQTYQQEKQTGEEKTDHASGGSDEKRAEAATAETSSSSPTGIVYELYGGQGGGGPFTDGSITVGSATTNDSNSIITQRLLRIEKIVGTPENNTHTTKRDASVLARVEDMEFMFQNLDSKTLEASSMKAKVIRSDLEAATKARNKLMALNTVTVVPSSSSSFLSTPGRHPTTPGGAGGPFMSPKQGFASPAPGAGVLTPYQQDTQAISNLYEQYVSLDGLSNHLPALVHRLKQLSSLHAQNSNYASRLGQSEKEIMDLQTTFGSIEKTLSQFETTMVTNFTKLEQNLEKLDQKE